MFVIFRDIRKASGSVPSLGGSLIPIEKDVEVSAFSVPADHDEPISLQLEAERNHVVIVSERGSTASVFIDFTAVAGDTCAVEIFLEPKARLTVLFLQRAGGQNIRITQRARVAEDATLHMQNVTIGSGVVTQDAASLIEGAHATSSIDWAFYACDKERCTLSARNVFHGRNGGGEITIKGVAEGHASARCDGMIEIGEAGNGTQTYLTEDVLMLDATAKVDAVPALEIRTNDVKASHSATVSRVSEADIFYFAARGIPADVARHMYVQGFLTDVLRSVEIQQWRETVETALREKYVR
jgi:Fe-S cluster assembly scaffold protein SufB